MFAAVFWDIDGVLVDSEPLHRKKIEAIALDPQRTGVPDPRGLKIEKSDWAELHGKGDHFIYNWIKARATEYPLDETKFLKACEDYYLAHVPQLKARSGAREAFNRFAAKGLHQVAVSSGVRAQVDANLKAADVKMLFSLAAGDTKEKKPNPEPYNTAHTRLLSRIENVSADLRDKSKCIVIEDSASGVEAGKKAGMTTIYWKLDASQPDSEYADYTISTAEELTALVARLTP
jgi:beta-phosphoglucomutase-like phosphatase (HAD superfamily)